MKKTVSVDSTCIWLILISVIWATPYRYALVISQEPYTVQHFNRGVFHAIMNTAIAELVVGFIDPLYETTEGEGAAAVFRVGVISGAADLEQEISLVFLTSDSVLCLWNQ